MSQSAGHFYRWEEIADFWLEEQWGQNMIVLRPYLSPRVIILLGSENHEKTKELVAKHIPFRSEPEKTWVDNAATWLTKKIPLDKPA